MESIPRKRQKTPQAICGSDLKQLSSNTNRRNFTLITTDVMVYSENILTEEKISESGFSLAFTKTIFSVSGESWLLQSSHVRTHLSQP